MMRSIIMGTVCPALLVTGSTLLGADAFDDLKFGVQVFTASPRVDLKALTSRPGVGAGLFAEQAYSKYSVIQTRLDYISYGKGTPNASASGLSLPIPSTPQTLSANAVSLGVDLKQFLPLSNRQSLFALVGLNGTRYEFKTTGGTSFDSDGNPLPGMLPAKDKTPVKLGFALGVGYEYANTWALTVRYTFTPSNNVMLSAIETGISARF
jgi:hypothetical protein